MAKPHVLEEFVIPLLKRLEITERKARGKNCGQKIIDKIKEARKDVETAKKILHQYENWESKLVGIFGEIERHLDYMLDDSGDQITAEFGTAVRKMNKMIDMRRDHEAAFKKKIKETFKKMRRSKKKLPNPSQQSIAEAGHSKDTEFSDDRVENGEIPDPYEVEYTMRQNPELALCYYSLAVWPKSTKFKKRFIIYWWIGLNLLQPKNTRTIEDTAEKHFNKLVWLGVLLPLKKAYNGTVDECIIEPEAHTQLIEAAKRNIIQDISGNTCGHFHVSAITANQVKLGVLTNFDQNYLKSTQILQCVKLLAPNSFKLCAMLLGQCSMEPHHIEVDKTNFFKELKPSLTYLSLQGISRIIELPDSIGNLVNLIVLDLRACHNLEKLPPKIKSMNNLTHLDVSMCYLLDHLPKWIGSLINLEILKGFVIGSLRNKDKCRLSDLTTLKKLRKLTMTINRVSEVRPEEVKSLKALTRLKSLTITWGKEGCDEIKENISPPSSLEKLDFRCYPKEEMPAWFDPEVLKNLKRLYIRGGMLKSFVKTGWNVEMLRLRFLKKFEIPWHDVNAMFTKLKVVECIKCKKMAKINTIDMCWRKERERHFVSWELLEQNSTLRKMWRREQRLRKLRELLEHEPKLVEQEYDSTEPREQVSEFREHMLRKLREMWQQEQMLWELLEKESESRELQEQKLKELWQQKHEIWQREQRLRELSLEQDPQMWKILLLENELREVLEQEKHFVFWELLERESELRELWQWEDMLRKLRELFEQEPKSKELKEQELELHEQMFRESRELWQREQRTNELLKQEPSSAFNRKMKGENFRGIQSLEVVCSEQLSELNKLIKKEEELQEQRMRMMRELEQEPKSRDLLEHKLKELRELLEQETELPEQKIKLRKVNDKKLELRKQKVRKLQQLWQQEPRLSELTELLELFQSCWMLSERFQQDQELRKLIELLELEPKLLNQEELNLRVGLGKIIREDLQMNLLYESDIKFKEVSDLCKECEEGMELLEQWLKKLWWRKQRLMDLRQLELKLREQPGQDRLLMMLNKLKNLQTYDELNELMKQGTELLEHLMEFEKFQFFKLIYRLNNHVHWLQTENPSFQMLGKLELWIERRRTMLKQEEELNKLLEQELRELWQEKQRLKKLLEKEPESMELLKQKLEELWQEEQVLRKCLQQEEGLMEPWELLVQTPDLRNLLLSANELTAIQNQERELSQQKPMLKILLRKESKLRELLVESGVWQEEQSNRS